LNWDPYLQPGERIEWEGRPAPRCFMFRNWRHSLFGVFLLLLAAYWQSVGIQMAEVYSVPVVAWIPVPVLLLGLYLALGHLALARWEWEAVFFALTDRRLLVTRGPFRKKLRTMALEDVVYFQLQPLGKDLGTLRIWGPDRNVRLTFSCLEHPRNLTEILERIMADSGNLARPN